MRQLTSEEQQRVCRLLADLVRIPSVVATPEQANRDRSEERVAEYLTGHLSRMGMRVERQEVFPGRPNLIASWPGQGTGKRLVFSAHMDTVPAEGMTVDPFAAEIREGRMYGRGACDTKASLASLLTALALAHEAGQLPSDRLCFVATMSEETGCDGATALVRSGFTADAAIVGEPTNCEVVTAHKSPLWMEIETHGRSCHASLPTQGANAIELMAKVVDFVGGPWKRHIGRRSHPLLGTSTCVVTTINGGSKINVIPSSCRAQIDGRLIPGEPVDNIVDDFTRMLADYLGGPEKFSILSRRTHPPLDCPADKPLPRKLLALCREANGQSAPRGVNYFADTGPFSEAGITSVLLGPGDIAQAHTADESVELQQVYQATQIILALLTRHAGQSIIDG
ncbi:MAG: M20 family metallopeptidase [Phycisphaerae bacterium]